MVPGESPPFFFHLAPLLCDEFPFPPNSLQTRVRYHLISIFLYFLGGFNERKKQTH